MDNKSNHPRNIVEDLFEQGFSAAKIASLCKIDEAAVRKSRREAGTLDNAVLEKMRTIHDVVQSSSKNVYKNSDPVAILEEHILVYTTVQGSRWSYLYELWSEGIIDNDYLLHVLMDDTLYSYENLVRDYGYKFDVSNSQDNAKSIAVTLDIPQYRVPDLLKTKPLFLKRSKGPIMNSKNNKPQHTGASFGAITKESDNNISVPPKLPRRNAVNAARPMPTLSPSSGGGTKNHNAVLPNHLPISDNFMGTNRYVGGTSISLNQLGGLDVGIGNGGIGEVVSGNPLVHIHTMKILNF